MSGTEPSGVILVTPAQLKALITSAVVEALEAHEPASAPQLLDRGGLAQALGVSLPIVDRLRREGCPRLRLGDVDRFDFSDVKRWLSTRGAPLRALEGGKR